MGRPCPNCGAEAIGRARSSPTNYNNTVALLQHVLDVAIEAGVIYANPAAALKRAAIRAKEIVLPSTEKFNGPQPGLEKLRRFGRAFGIHGLAVGRGGGGCVAQRGLGRGRSGCPRRHLLPGKVRGKKD